ncbi:hypothetical protein [Thalassotalea piscium]|uniref:hypothetical protein n=1 Tax=Thalassotalea piscium TaxID=1230533 RepID=UPI0025730776|nr:hypothetical protein [Thalassotalea piscium]
MLSFSYFSDGVNADLQYFLCVGWASAHQGFAIPCIEVQLLLSFSYLADGVNADLQYFLCVGWASAHQ